MSRIAVLAVVVVVVIVVGAVAMIFLSSHVPEDSNINPPPPPPEPPSEPPPDASPCPKTTGLCIERVVTRVIDGDTLDVEGGLRIRLVLVNAPELSETGGQPAKSYLTSLCLGKIALIDEDDWQIDNDPYGRVLAVVHCTETNANSAMISSGHAVTYTRFCSESEFGNESWTGCP